MVSTLPSPIENAWKASSVSRLLTVNILINVGLNLFFYLLCPFLEKKGISVPFYQADGGVAIFISYLVSSVCTLVMLFPYIFRFKFASSFSLLKDILKYSYPILIVSVAGMINFTGR